MGSHTQEEFERFIHHGVSMILRLATANENGRGTGVPPVKSEDQTSMPRLDWRAPT